MTTEHMRTYISEYPKYKNSEKWKARVKHMGPKQVYAVYMKLKNTKPEPESEHHSDIHQITMFEYMDSVGGSEVCG